jgi:hypothetical protein
MKGVVEASVMGNMQVTKPKVINTFF